MAKSSKNESIIDPNMSKEQKKKGGFAKLDSTLSKYYELK